MSELDKIAFLMGRWEGRYSDQFGEKGLLESRSECTWALEKRYLRWEGETTKDGAPLNKSLQVIGFDQKLAKFVMKRFWSYGFIENGVGWLDDSILYFDIVSVDNSPPWFEGIRWRSFVKRYSEDEVGTGLLASKDGGEYKPYGESRVRRVAG